MNWTVEFLDEQVEAFIKALPRDLRARFQHIIRLIKEYGLERVHEPHVKHIEDSVWEMRMKGRDKIARAFYVTASGKRVVVVHAFVKKTQKTPRREITKAHKKAKEVK